MADPLGSVEKMVKVALLIKEAVETVRRNKEECHEIEKLVERLSAILDRLHGVTNHPDPAMSGPLEDLAESMDCALQLVTRCQERHSVIGSFFTARDVAKQLRRVHDDMNNKMMFVSPSYFYGEVTNWNTHCHPSLEGNRPGLPPFFGAVQKNSAHECNSAPPEEAADHLLPFHHPVCDGTEGLYLQPDSPPRIGKTVSINRAEVMNGEEDYLDYLRLPAKSSTVPNLLWESDVEVDSPTNASQRYSVCQHLFTCFSDLSDLILELLRYKEAEVISLYPSEVSQATCGKGFTKFSLSELESATHNFLEGNIIGQGAFATVYKGVLHDGLVVAIKKMQYPYHISMAHISHVLKLKHTNIIELLGYGHGGDEDYYVFLVEEYMPHGSMDNIIYGSQFDWSSRLRLIQGIAHGLHYLHDQQFVHLDLKPNNVLVDSDINPKITDFGRAKMLAQGDDVASGDTDYLLVGTMGYMPPEYIIEGTVSTMYDVYSFGVILLETISGMCRSEPARHQASIEWAWVAREVGRMEEVLDRSLCSESQLKEVRRCMEIGLLCTQSDRADRPTMLDVVEMLNNKKQLPTPKQPKYTKVPRN